MSVLIFHERVLRSVEFFGKGQEYIYQILSQPKVNMTKLARTCKLWIQNSPDSLEIDSVDFNLAYKEAIPDSKTRAEFLDSILPEITPDVMYLVERRRDFEMILRPHLKGSLAFDLYFKIAQSFNKWLKVDTDVEFFKTSLKPKEDLCQYLFVTSEKDKEASIFLKTLLCLTDLNWSREEQSESWQLVQRAVTGLSSQKRKWTFKQLVNVLKLFNYSAFWLDFLLSRPGEDRYHFSKLTLEKMIEPSVEKEMLGIFKGDKISFEPVKCVVMAFDVVRRLYKEEGDIKTRIELPIAKGLYELPQYLFFDYSDLKTNLMRNDLRKLLAKIYQKSLEQSDNINNWLESNNPRSYEVGTNKKIFNVTVNSVLYPLEAVMFKLYLYETLASLEVPKKDRLSRLGRLFFMTDKIEPDKIMSQVLLQVHGWTMVAGTLYNHFHAACCHTTGKPLRQVWERTYVKNDRMESFIRLYLEMTNPRETMSSVATFLGGPCFGFTLHTLLEGKAQIISAEEFMAILKNACRNRLSLLMWVEKRFTARVFSALPHTIRITDTRFTVDLLNSYDEFDRL